MLSFFFTTRKYYPLLFVVLIIKHLKQSSSLFKFLNFSWPLHKSNLPHLPINVLVSSHLRFSLHITWWFSGFWWFFVCLWFCFCLVFKISFLISFQFEVIIICKYNIFQTHIFGFFLKTSSLTFGCLQYLDIYFTTFLVLWLVSHFETAAFSCGAKWMSFHGNL